MFHTCIFLCTRVELKKRMCWVWLGLPSNLVCMQEGEEGTGWENFKIIDKILERKNISPMKFPRLRNALISDTILSV